MLFNANHLCTIQRRYSCKKLTYTGASGTTPAVGATVTGGTSKATGVITRLFTGYLVVKDVVGTFSSTEGVTATGWSATLTAVADYTNQQGAPEYYWYDNQTSVRCRFYRGGKGGNAVMTQSGTMVLKPLAVALPNTVTIAEHTYRITTTDTAYAGTYEITVFPKGGMVVTDHIECVLTKVISP